jgi:hypothetical protein
VRIRPVPSDEGCSYPVSSGRSSEISRPACPTPDLKLNDELHHDHGPSLRRAEFEALLIYSMSVSVDGFIADREGGFGWTVPDEELFGFHLARVRELGCHWFASESMTQIRVLISPHLRGFRLHQEGVLDDRAGTFSRQQWRPSREAVSLAFAEV